MRGVLGCEGGVHEAGDIEEECTQIVAGPPLKRCQVMRPLQTTNGCHVLLLTKETHSCTGVKSSKQIHADDLDKS